MIRILAGLALLAATLQQATAHPEQSLDLDEISVLVLYTPGVTVYHNGRDGAEAHIYSMIASANQAFENSQATIRLKLAHAEEIEYYESIEPQEDLDRLWYPNDGYLDQVKELRLRHGADLVTLLRRERGAATSGRGYILTDAGGNEEIAYSVVTTESAISGFLFAHEIGHNLGAGHQKEDQNALGLFDYSHAHSFEASGSRRTIMYSHFSSESIPYFSNPDISYESMPTGTLEEESGANNALTLSKTGKRIAAYRQDPLDSFNLLDAKLEAVIRQALGKFGGELTSEDMAMLTSLEAPAQGIASLSGLEAAINLKSLDLKNNEIEDISTLVRLENLGTIDISGNRIDLNSGSLQKRLVDQLLQSGKKVLAASQMLTEPGKSEIVNISARGFSGLGDEILLLGFTLSGNEAADFELHGIGPSLKQTGSSFETLYDPAISLYKGSNLIAENLSWDTLEGSSPFSGGNEEDRVTPLRDKREAAMNLSLGSGSYGLIASDETKQSGIGLLEVYRNQIASKIGYGSKIVNFSARGLVGRGDQQLIVGFSIRGETPLKIVARATGLENSLGSEQGLDDPAIRIFDLSNRTIIAENDDWDEGDVPFDLSEQINRVGARPLLSGASDAAVSLELPGNRNYAILTSGQEIGLGLVELFVIE